MSNLVGDSLVSAAFLAYIGFFDFFYRKTLLKLWTKIIQQEINIRHDLSLIDFLSTPAERLLWKSQSLPEDSLCLENAIILNKFNRYPLVFDPSGQGL